MIPIRKEYSNESYQLYNDYNDVHIFIEDSGFENLYEEIFKKSHLNIFKIFSKNGKSELLESADKCTDKRCVFLIDRDWDDALNKIYSKENIIVLDKHSIENYLINYVGFLSLLKAEKPRCRNIDFINQSLFDVIVDNVSSKLRPLFECFLSMLFDQNINPSCSYKPGHFKKKDNSYEPDVNKISIFISEQKTIIHKNAKEYFNNDVVNKGHGKYLLSYIWEAFRRVSKIKQIHYDTLKVRLAQCTDSKVFQNIFDKIYEKSINT